MKIGIGLPSTIPGVSGTQILDWAKHADNGPFSSLGCLGRVVYSNYDPLITLAAAAAVTRRIRLMTTVLVAPLYNPALLAKQAASIDALSNGRLTLGMAAGAREDDFRAVEAGYHDRGKRFNAQLKLMKSLWTGARFSEEVGPVGPPPIRKGGPELLIGGYSPAIIRRLVRWGDGYIAGSGAAPAQIKETFQKINEAWDAAGRTGKPRLAGAFYFGIEPENKGRSAATIRDYYGFIGPRAEYIINSLPLTAEAIKNKIKPYLDTGMDELILWPCIPDLDQVDRLADVVGSL
jgi:alkanesulfonate monooxygenase SsuD/methylene tetrahydromethanopterin reductase-like flavin-dependent oxidoreductase (luciferase family)